MFQSGKLAGGKILRDEYPSPVEGSARKPAWLEQSELIEDKKEVLWLGRYWDLGVGRGEGSSYGPHKPF